MIDFIPGSSNSSGTAEIGGYRDDTISSRTPMPQNSQGAYHSVSRARSNYTQRFGPNCRGASSSNLHLGHLESSDEGSLLCAETYPSRHPRPLSSIGWRNSDRSGRTRISSDRYRSFSNEARLHDRLTSEVCMSFLNNLFSIQLTISSRGIAITSLSPGTCLVAATVSLAFCGVSYLPLSLTASAPAPWWLIR